MSGTSDKIKQEALRLGKQAKVAARLLAPLSSAEKNRTLLLMAGKLEAQSTFLVEENNKDIEFAKENGVSTAVLDRIALDAGRVHAMAKGLREVVALPDPVREVTKMWRRPNGLQVGRMRIPLGVIGMIYEARPNVTADAAALCLKSGNAVILRGGSEAHHSNQAIGAVLRQACTETRRGGEELIRAVVANSKVPVIKHYKGVCHVYVDADASLEMAERICFNAKVQRPSVCNAMETLLVHEAIAAKFLPPMIAKFQTAGVEVRGCEKTRALAPGIKPASDADWTEEYLDLILAVRIVKDMDQAIDHIERYGSEHTETIVTTNYQKSREFIDRVNSSAVMVNASTRFNDGGELGLGAEIGISTSKIHAFGPMGLEELTTTKFIVFGDGQIRE